MDAHLSTALAKFVRRIEETTALDLVAERMRPLARRLTQRDAVKRTLSGTPLGHRLHPMLTDIPIGCWTSASLIDLAAWRTGERSARLLVGAGIVASVPTIASGLSDWDDTHGASRRIGTAHATANTVGLLLQLGSWRARRKGRHARGAALGAASLAVLTLGGYLGGHLVFAQRAGVDHDVPLLDDHTWHEVGRTDELNEGDVVSVTIDGARIALVQSRGGIFALAAVCSHAGGPLDEGEVRDGALVCPWHGSAFCVETGDVERGPATSPQPTYETRIRGEIIEVRATETPRLHAAV